MLYFHIAVVANSEGGGEDLMKTKTKLTQKKRMDNWNRRN